MRRSYRIALATTVAATLPFTGLGSADATPDLEPAPPVAVGMNDDLTGIRFVESDTGVTYADADTGDVVAFAASPVRNEVFYAQVEEDQTFIYSMEMGGSASQFVDEGDDPAVSGNGRFLAYAVDYYDDEPGSPRDGITVRDLDTGNGRTFWYEAPWDSDPDPQIEQMAVSWDGRYVAFAYWDQSGIRVLDTATATTLNDARLVLSSGEGDVRYYHSPVFVGDGRVAAARSYDTVASTGNPVDHVVAVSTDGTYPEDIFDLPRSLGEIETLDVDDSGGHLLMGVGEGESPDTYRYVSAQFGRTWDTVRELHLQAQHAKW